MIQIIQLYWDVLKKLKLYKDSNLKKQINKFFFKKNFSKKNEKTYNQIQIDDSFLEKHLSKQHLEALPTQQNHLPIV